MDRRPSALEEVILSPGAVSINVKGAFIAEDASVDDGAFHETHDIRLPNHKAVVSHVALDVWNIPIQFVWIAELTASR